MITVFNWKVVFSWTVSPQDHCVSTPLSAPLSRVRGQASACFIVRVPCYFLRYEGTIPSCVWLPLALSQFLDQHVIDSVVLVRRTGLAPW